MTTSSRSSKKDDRAALPGELQGIDRLFGRDLKSRGWAIDLDRIARSGGGADALRDSGEDTPDPAIIWVLRGRRR